MVSTGIPIIRPVKLGAPHLNDLREPLEKNHFDLLVQFRNPLLQVGVTFQVQPINLPKGFSEKSCQTKKVSTYSSLDLVQQFRECLGGIRTSRKVVHRP